MGRRAGLWVRGGGWFLFPPGSALGRRRGTSHLAYITRHALPLPAVKVSYDQLHSSNQLTNRHTPQVIHHRGQRRPHMLHRARGPPQGLPRQVIHQVRLPHMLHICSGRPPHRRTRGKVSRLPPHATKCAGSRRSGCPSYKSSADTSVRPLPLTRNRRPSCGRRRRLPRLPPRWGWWQSW